MHRIQSAVSNPLMDLGYFSSRFVPVAPASLSSRQDALPLRKQSFIPQRVSWIIHGKTIRCHSKLLDAHVNANNVVC
jgi:hypothetical protein